MGSNLGGFWPLTVGHHLNRSLIDLNALWFVGSGPCGFSCLFCLPFLIGSDYMVMAVALLPWSFFRMIAFLWACLCCVTIFYKLFMLSSPQAEERDMSPCLGKEPQEACEAIRFFVLLQPMGCWERSHPYQRLLHHQLPGESSNSNYLTIEASRKSFLPYLYIYSFLDSHHYSLLQDNDYSSLCYTVGPCLYIVVHIC